MPRSANAGDWAALLALTILWGTAFAINEVALASFPPALIVAGRVTVAAAVLYVFMRANGVALPRTPRAWRPMLVLAVFGNLLPFQLVASAQQHIQSSMAGVLMAIMPLFVLTLAHFFVPGARLTPSRVAGFVIGFAGVVFVIGPDALSGVADNAALWGALAVLGAALSYAINSIYARRLGAANPIQLSADMMLAASVLMIPASAHDVPWTMVPSSTSIAALLVLGLFSTGFATVLYFRVIQGPGPTFLSLVNYLVPAWAVLAGAWFLDETLALPAYLGLALILCGIAVSELGPRTVRAIRSHLRSKPLLVHAAAEER